MGLEDLPRTIEWVPGGADTSGSASPFVSLIDQRKLPERLVRMRCTGCAEIETAIANMAVRGAPAIGIAGAFAIALWASCESREDTPEAFLRALDMVSSRVAAVRPTAINLSWAASEMRELAHTLAKEGADLRDIKDALVTRARAICDDDEARCKAIGERGADLLQLAVQDRFACKPSEDGSGGASVAGLRILTHCNAGSLAAARWGTALSIVYEAHVRGLVDKVWVDETRPVNQGSRLTAWELGRAGVNNTLICDDMAASVMSHGWVDAVIVGADVVCANGDVVNKIGTYCLAVLARAHGIPFYVAAPNSTIAPSKKSLSGVAIEQRDPGEILESARTPAGQQVYNPAFDATPAKLVTAVITERGVFEPQHVLDSLA